MKSAKIIIVLLLFLSLSLSACASENLPPSDIARRYLENNANRTFSIGYDLLTSDSQLKISRSQYVDRLSRAYQDAGIFKTEIVRLLEPNIAGKRASVAYQLEVTLQNNEKLTLFESMILLQQENGWRVIWPPQ